jgi:hypothetical protein
METTMPPSSRISRKGPKTSSEVELMETAILPIGKIAVSLFLFKTKFKHPF